MTRRHVTPIRNISGKFSGSRNAGSDPGEFDPDACHYCRKRFDRGQMRYPIRNFNWPEPDFVSVCMSCFKEADLDVTSKQKRYERQCNGCGEPILNPSAGVFAWQVCSKRCYQRAYRKRRRENGGSTVSWKGSMSVTCEACKKPLKQTRSDARFCSNACRQSAYRKRNESNHPINRPAI